MRNNTNKVILWLKEFKHNWLPQKISNDTHLLEIITTKLHELEQIIIQNNPDEHRIIIDDESNCETEQQPPPPPSERSLANVSNQVCDETENRENVCRPAICLKRISLAEAAQFLPASWKIPKSKRGRKKERKAVATNGKKIKKDTQTKKLILSSLHDETPTIIIPQRKSIRSKKNTQQYPSTSFLTSTQSNPDNNNKKVKRKLRALEAEDDDLYTLGNLSQLDNINCDNNNCERISRYIGQNGILSQTRKTNETTMDDDFTIKLHTRKANVVSETCLNDDVGLPLDEESVPTDEEEQLLNDIIESNDNESLFASLDIPSRDKPLETNSISNNNSIMNYNDCIEDISNDGIDPPPSSSSPNIPHFAFNNAKVNS